MTLHEEVEALLFLSEGKPYLMEVSVLNSAQLEPKSWSDVISLKYPYVKTLNIKKQPAEECVVIILSLNKKALLVSS